MNKEEVLQKANEYCSEKGYTNETLTDDFKDKFSDFFSKKYPETDVNDEAALADLKFNLNTAFSATSKGITAKVKVFEEKENSYKSQIAELNKKLGTQQEPQANPQIPKELQEKLVKLEKFETEARLQQKVKEVLDLAKKNVREDLHKSLENYASDFAVNLEDASDEQARKLTARFQEIFKDSIGDTKPYFPRQTKKQEEEFLSSLPKIKV